MKASSCLHELAFVLAPYSGASHNCTARATLPAATTPCRLPAWSEIPCCHRRRCFTGTRAAIRTAFHMAAQAGTTVHAACIRSDTLTNLHVYVDRFVLDHNSTFSINPVLQSKVRSFLHFKYTFTWPTILFNYSGSSLFLFALVTHFIQINLR